MHSELLDKVDVLPDVVGPYGLRDEPLTFGRPGLAMLCLGVVPGRGALVLWAGLILSFDSFPSQVVQKDDELPLLQPAAPCFLYSDDLEDDDSAGEDHLVHPLEVDEGVLELHGEPHRPPLSELLDV